MMQKNTNMRTHMRYVKQAVIIFLLTCSCDFSYAQPTMEEVTFLSLGRSKFKAPDGQSAAIGTPPLALNINFVGSSMYAMMDLTSIPYLGLTVVSDGKEEYEAPANKDGIEGIDMVLFGSWGVGDIMWENDNYSAGVGITLDILRWNYVIMDYKDDSFKQEMAGVSLMGNALMLRKFSDAFYNLLFVQFGPTFTNRENEAVDGYVFFLKNSFSYGIGKWGISIAPELRYYRTKDINDDLWKSNTLLLHLGVSHRM